MRIFVIAIYIMLLASPARAGELIFGWDFKTESGRILDMHFLPGDDQFILTTNGKPMVGGPTTPMMQIRNTHTGELIEEFPDLLGHIEFSMDSTKLIIAKEWPGAKIEIFDLNEKRIIRKDTMTVGKDSLDPHNNIFKLKIDGMVADPVRPYVYLLWKKSNFILNYNIDTMRVLIYDYEQMKIVGDLTPPGFLEYSYFEKIAISADGKYLAALNRGRAHLWVWDLETREIITRQQLYDGTEENRYQAILDGILFSKLNTEKLYFSCYCPGNAKISGSYAYNVVENKIITDEPHFNFGGILVLFDNEERMCFTLGYETCIYNVKNNEYEFKIKTSYPEPGTWATITYSKINDIFIGFLSEHASSGIYDRQVSINESDSKEQILYPNPTIEFITISGMADPTQTIDIYTLAGVNIMSAAGPRVDVSHLTPGVYFVRVGGRSLKFVKI